jgi:N-acetylglucosaminyldiphosphoundecaprenol N-acetyl-beta-D-mannosaminyltransferase
VLGPLRHREVSRLTGVDLLDWLASQSGQLGSLLFLLGGTSGAADETAEVLTGQYPDAVIAGTWDGGTASQSDDLVALERIAASKATIIAVAYGAPGQVIWIERNRKALEEVGVRVAIGVGGAFDYFARVVPRAPRTMQRLGLEWLYRLVRQPWRWRRQLVLPEFMVLMMFEALAVHGDRLWSLLRQSVFHRERSRVR